MDILNVTLKAAKYVGCFVVSAGIGAVAKNIIQSTTPDDVKKVAKICINVGSFVIAGLAAEAASNKFNKTMDLVTGVVAKFTDEMPKPKKDMVIESDF